MYSKGALFLARLRELVGDDAFFALLQYHYQTHKYGLLTADDFRRSIEAVADADSGLIPHLRPFEEELAQVLALYDAVVVRGEPIEGFEGLIGLEGLEGLGPLFGGELSPENLGALMQLLEELLQGLEPQ